MAAAKIGRRPAKGNGNSAMNKHKEKSVISQKNVVIVALGVALLLFLASGSIYRYVRGGGLNPFEMVSMLIIVFALVERSQGSYELEADGRSLKIRKQAWLGSKELSVDYRDIIGIYKYKAKLIGYVKFRRTHRMNSALDGRTVWAIAYKVGVSGKPEHYERIYFKPSGEMLEFLSGRMPGKVMIPEKKVVVAALQEEQAREQNKQKQ